MKKTLILATAAATGLILGSMVQAGNVPNSTRTLTSGISSGTTTGRVPSSHPYTSRSRGYASSGHSRSSYANHSLSKFANGSSHRPDNSYRSGSSGSSHSRPTSIPATLPAQATGHVPTSIGGVGGNSGVSNPPPSSIPATLPGQAAGHVPGQIGGSGMSGSTAMTRTVSNPPPVSIPATIPAQAAGHVPLSIGGTGMGNLPPSSIPADIPTQAAGHVPGTIGGRH